MKKMLHAVTCNDCDFSFEEIAIFPSEAWYNASEHDMEFDHEINLIHAAV